MPASRRTSYAIAVTLGCLASTMATADRTAETLDRATSIDDRMVELQTPSPLPPIDVDNSRIESYELVPLTLPADLPDAFDLDFDFDGMAVSVSLQRTSVRGEGFRLLVDHGDGLLVDTPVEAPRTYRGTAFGLDRDIASASLLDDGISLMVHRTVGPDLAIQPASDFDLDAPPNTHVVYWADQAFAEGHCGTLPPDPPLEMGPVARRLPDDGGVAGTQLYVADVGIDCDHEFYTRLGSSVSNAVNSVELIMNNTNVIYERDVDIIFEISTLVVRSDPSDPYSTSTIDGRLTEFRNTWNSSPESEIRRDVAHMFSGVNFSGGAIGLAFLGVLCNFGNSYGVVESLYTTNLTFRTSLTAHELGHNWGSAHCDGSSPCNIMCSSNGGCNGISGSNLKFGTSAQNQIVSYRNSGNGSCAPAIGDSLALPFEDDFETAPAASDWIHNNGAAASTAGVNEPNGVRSLNLDATSGLDYGDDEIRTNFLQMNVSTVYASYYVQHRGVEAGESLFFEYKNVSGDWVTIEEHVSDGTDQTSFVFFEHLLPAGARYGTSRLRFRANVDQSNDDFFVDSFRVATDPASTAGNDECGDATEVFGGANPFSTEGATDSGIDDALTYSTSSGPEVRRDVWFTYTATCTGPLEFSTCGASDFDLRMSVYLASSGCPASGALPFACDDDGCGTGARINTFTLAGQTFIIRIGSSDGSTGSAVLDIDCGALPPPANDDCTGATVVAEGVNNVSSLNATDSEVASQLSCSASSGPTVLSDVWFSYTADCTGQVDISTCDAPFDSRLDVYDGASGCPASGDASVTCADDVCGDDPSVSTLLLEGQTVLIRVGSSDGATGDFALEIVCTPFEEPCPGDFNGDGSVDGADLGALLGAWGTATGDLNGDETTNGADLGIFLSAWGSC